MSTTALNAEVRNEFGKGASRRNRRAGLVPAVLYGHGTEPVHLTLPGHETTLATRHANVLLEVHFGGKSELALVKSLQRHPVKRSLEHLDLLLVKRGEKVHVEVPVHVEGETFSGTMLTLDAHAVSVEAEATHLPESLTLNVEGAEDGTVFHASDLVLPKGTTLLVDADTVIAVVSVPRGAVAEDAEAAAEGEAAAGGEAAAE
ncbi:50S ribosomal protein L25/general stress protein Ctc [Micrococcales bacterium 31B]|nr:50S ribosomal protein L25/general stress protein Ctc [Micrococcales bacterium 31B]